MTQHLSTFAQSDRQGRGRPALDQARPFLVIALLCLGACDTPGQINPRLLFRDATGAASEARLPPPGLDRPSPNLADVPPIPERPDLAAREALTRLLETERAAAATPVPELRPDSQLTERAAPGQPPIPARPPGPPMLAAAPIVPWGAAPITARPAAAQPSPAPEPDAPVPGAIPALPTPDLLTPGPVAPDLLAPGSVPAPPPSDLLAPARRR